MDVEKIIKGLECCTMDGICTGCPYEVNDDGNCIRDCMKDALEVVKEFKELSVGIQYQIDKAYEEMDNEL
ncbi:MAG: hypothetical protein MJ225_04825 [Bacilli bacterium]|nr:hypothetical protein [Bacilli bacterium]